MDGLFEFFEQVTSIDQIVVFNRITVGSLTIKNSDTSGEIRLDAVSGGKVVRVALVGKSYLSLPEVKQLWVP